MKKYDYTSPGYYSFTIDVQGHHQIIGKIVNNQIQYNESDMSVKDTWFWSEKQYSYIELDEWILMPDHLHGIIGYVPDQEKCTMKPLGRIIGVFKTVSTIRINILQRTPGQRIWQRDFYDYFVRNAEDLERIRWYIANNPKNF